MRAEVCVKIGAAIFFLLEYAVLFAMILHE